MALRRLRQARLTHRRSFLPLQNSVAVLHSPVREIAGHDLSVEQFNLTRELFTPVSV